MHMHALQPDVGSGAVKEGLAGSDNMHSVMPCWRKYALGSCGIAVWSPAGLMHRHELSHLNGCM